VTLDCAHDQLTPGVTGSTCSGQFNSVHVCCERGLSGFYPDSAILSSVTLPGLKEAVHAAQSVGRSQSGRY